ncbi:MAG: FAD-dependent oxidoreductase, partial [Atopobium minutum]|nr:FAD-dependent oxidoreductase [Atopobium minutum]
NIVSVLNYRKPYGHKGLSDQGKVPLMSKIVVIGANHAGTAASNTILDLYKGNELTIIDQNSNISFLGCGMALWIGKQISGSDGLFYQTKEGFESKGAQVFMETRVDSIDYDAKKVHAIRKDGSEIEESYDKLILATGSLPIIPPFEGRDLENIQQVKLFQDAQAVIDKLKDPSIRKVTVLGAGYIGVELAEAFERNGREVDLIDMAPTCLTGNFDREFSDLMADELERGGVKLHFGEAVLRFEGKNGKVSRVVTDKGGYDADMVVICTGFKPNTELFANQGFEMLKNGALVVDHHQKTSKDDVYAIGDCSATFFNAKDGEESYIALATNAVRSGIVAGHNVCGTALESIGVQGSSGINIYDLKMVSTGLTEEHAKAAGFDAKVSDFTAAQKALFMETDNPEVKIRIVYDATTRKVLGAQMASTYDMTAGIHMYSLAIQEGITIDRLALLDVFFLPHFNQPYNFYTMAAYSAVLNG